MKTKFAIYSVLLAGLLLTIMLNCKKEAMKVAPTVTITEATNVTANSATVSSTITADGGSEVLSRGVCWNSSGNPTTSDNKTTDGKGMGSFTSSLTSLSPGTTYNLKSYATNAIGTAYSSQTTFKTQALLATLTTTDASAISSISVSSGGNITNDGGAEVTARGVCWSTTQNPTSADSKTTDGTGSGIFTSSITGLTPGTTYYIRSYSTNSIGTAYGNQVTAITLAILPTVTTADLSLITSTTSTGGGNITNDGGATITDRGVCWSTSQNPTIADSKSSDGTSKGVFSSNITGLTPGSTYYFRAYATNSIGTAYGNQISSTTTAILPTITTTVVTKISALSAVSGGNITNDGGAPITVRGVCWGPSQTPTTTNSKTTDGTGKGVFTSSILELAAGTTYYIRAYATNSIGTAYGDAIAFTTVIPSTQSDVKPIGLIPATDAELDRIPTIDSIDPSLIPSLKSGVVLPSSNSIAVPPVENQGSQNSCVGFAIGYGSMSYIFKIYEGNDDYNGRDRLFSPNYIWNQLNGGQNRGISLPAAMDLIKSQGCCKLTDMDISSNATDQPSSTAKTAAAKYKISEYYRFTMSDIENDKMKTYLSKNYPIVVGILVDNGFQKNDNSQFEKQSDGRLVWKTYNDNSRYGHAMLICGYDDAIHAYKVLNSWSSQWGDNGFCWIDYDFFRTTAERIPGSSYCEVFVGLVKRPLLTTNDVSGITSNLAQCGGAISSDGGSSVTSRGVCWSKMAEPTISDDKSTDGTGIGTFTSSLTGLDADRMYYVKAYAINSQGVSYGYQKSFITSKATSLPTVTTVVASSITTNSATSGGNVTADGNASVTAKGVCWSTSQNPTTANSKTTDGTGTGSFSSSITSLTPSTTYYVRSYAINSVGTAYSSQLSFTTSVQLQLPTITTTAATSLDITSATSGGNITSDGGATVTARGVCWSSSTSSPTISNSKTTNGTGTGSFTSSITGLNPNTTYYVRAYAINSVGTAYGTQVSFSTDQTTDIPSVTTASISSITQTTATGGGNVTSDGNSTVTVRGVCWSTSSNPTISNSKTANGTGTGSFTSSITGLSANTTYYVRAYATNSEGTAYGSNVSFTTNSVQAQVPTLTTTAASAIATTSAQSGGNISSDGGAAVTARGVCWSTSQNPTTSNTKTTDGTGTGSFISNITGLSPNTTYYVKAYATNSAGTGYGSQISMTTTTSGAIPTLTTTAASSISTTSAASGGSISSDGGATVTARGVCWSTSSNPTTSNNKTADGTGTGSFSSSITGLSSSTTYYVRSYATNSAGTAYGNQISITTTSNSGGTVTDIDGNVYNTVTIGTQVWMAENLKTTKYNDGTAIPLITDGTAWYQLTTPGYCWYNNDATTYKGTYGALYNWYTVNTGKLCPTGWHVPTDAEWTTLTTYLGGEGVAGGKLKETGTSHWLSPNTGATNETGFTALPGGYRSSNVSFGIVGNTGIWWSSMEYSTTLAWHQGVFYNFSNVYRLSSGKQDGFSVRCVRD